MSVINQLVAELGCLKWLVCGSRTNSNNRVTYFKCMATLTKVENYISIYNDIKMMMK